MRRVLLIEDLPQVAQHLQGLLAREAEFSVIGVHAQAEPAIAQAASERPEVVIVDALLQGKIGGLEVAKRIRAAWPGARIVVVTVPKRPVTPRADEGVDAVFVLPGGANELTHALGADPGPKAVEKGEVLAVFSPKGGTGKTTIAANLACALRRAGSTVALVDGVMQFGSIRHLFEIPPGIRSIVDLPPGAAMRTSISEVLWEGPGGMNVLLAPPKPEEADLVASLEIGNAVTLLAASHDYVLVDTPARLGDDTLAIFDASTTILLVVTQMDATVANTRAAIDTFDALGYRANKRIVLVINQADPASGISRAAIEHLLGLPAAAEIPVDWSTVSAANNAHLPFVLSSPDAGVSRAITGLAATLVAFQRAAP